MTTEDIWIPGPRLLTVGAQEFCRIVHVPLPGRVDIGTSEVQFNITAYVKHMIERAKSA